MIEVERARATTPKPGSSYWLAENTVSPRLVARQACISEKLKEGSALKAQARLGFEELGSFCH